MINILYTPLIGLPACVLLNTVGVLACLTIIGIPVGLAMFSLGFKALTIR